MLRGDGFASFFALALVVSVIFLITQAGNPSQWKFMGRHGSSDVNLNAGNDIQWRRCPHIEDPVFECGTLETPLDYTNASDSRTASIEVIRYKAGGGQTNREEVIGSVILNPGGPGGSGLGFLARNGSADSIDSILDHRFDLVSFDPRGVGHTWPRVQCFGDAYADFLYSTMVAVSGLPGLHHSDGIKNYEIRTTLAYQQLLGEVCMRHKDADLFRFMSTPFTARDMQRLHLALGDSKLNYWGFSYGSVLGSTYADMFPDDINRIVIDGVTDAPNYFEGLWSHRLKDVEQELDGFFVECIKGGPEFCQLSTLSSDKDGVLGSAESLKVTVLQYINRLRAHPIPLAKANPPQILTASNIMSKFYTVMYAPKSWPKFADSLYEAIANNNATSLATSVDLSHLTEDSESEATYAISCGDSQYPPAESNGESAWGVNKFYHHMDPILKDSPLFALASGATSRATCSGAWRYRGAERYTGSFNATTAFPLLAIGNDFDPATPGRYADAMAQRFGNAVSVRREGYGHCSSSQPSRCIDDIVKNYFIDGHIPKQGTYCPVDEPVFGDRTSPASPIAMAILESTRRSTI